ncbi:MAG: ABC transporter permease DevC [Anabaena sp. CoA2_C59]|jgi:putative ABC transport system permease protein|uniref:FtsX-like permease family protein n=2 Tax=Aphanizomenon flos-aquae TaxID=1176 RepID=A0ABR8ITM3_APHFL|nr:MULTISPECIES: ABC transporter permease DevC [Aphanizomenon]MCE2905065.1 ABC transporter permease DevC [Anabaena sp. CoA2_C59]MDJ0504411.1 ABC transporter permease DevC [Nostocales cyanobacterium LE14-WE12]MBD2391194.1 FtsX-like permease family protein [Aphanizomenon flos-aquae FACHB-1171]MBD2556533.1 FtsX-like permease family protein [Aphanizomenon flos-aquae FACHB-1290]MBD2632090.1 FtsX-like permease family protein [Aphanizomenon sp. FACHB-1399]
MILNIPLPWLQLVKQKVRFFVALAGIAFISVLMFMQIGFQDALYASATQVHKHLRGDLFLISSQYKSLTSTQSFPRSRLHQILGFNGTESVEPLYVQFAKLKNPINGRKYPIYILGFDPVKSIFKLPEVDQNFQLLKIPDQVFFDRAARPEFGPIAEYFQKNQPIGMEIFSYLGTIGYKVKVSGLFTLGPSFGVDGNLIVSSSTFFNIFPEHRSNQIDIGLIHLKPNVNPQAILTTLSNSLPKDVTVMTRQEFIDFEKSYWTLRTPIGFVFNLMVMMGFVVGVIVVYQILYSNISTHIVQFATLKAMGFRNKYLLNVVFQQAVILAILGYIPGFAISLGLYDIAKNATKLPIVMDLNKGLLVFISVIVMCLTSGFFSTNKLRKVDPAEIFN